MQGEDHTIWHRLLVDEQLLMLVRVRELVHLVGLVVGMLLWPDVLVSLREQEDLLDQVLNWLMEVMLGRLVLGLLRLRLSAGNADNLDLRGFPDPCLGYLICTGAELLGYQLLVLFPFPVVWEELLCVVGCLQGLFHLCRIRRQDWGCLRIGVEILLCLLCL